MEQMILILVITLLVWLATGIGHEAASIESSAFGSDTNQTMGSADSGDHGS